MGDIFKKYFEDTQPLSMWNILWQLVREKGSISGQVNINGRER